MANRKLILLAFIFLLSAGAGQLFAAPKTRERSPSPLSDSMRKVRKSPSLPARDAFRKFSMKQGKGWKIRYNPRTALPEALTGGRTARYPGTPEQAAAAFFEDNKELLKVEPSVLRLTVKKEFMGVTHLQYQQYSDGLPVEFSYARVHVSETGEVSGYQGKYEPEITVNTAPGISGEAAVMAARADLGRQLKVSRTELVIFPDESDGALKLAWKIRGRGNGLWVYYINAADGAVLLKYDDLRYVYATSGASYGTVYPVSPLPGYNVDSMSFAENDYWTVPVTLPLRDQYFWVGGYSSMTVTNASGVYQTEKSGKVFSSLKGPYFAVTNFRGPSAHFDNGAGEWFPAATPAQTPHPYSNSGSYSYPITVPDNWTIAGYRFAKAMPRFSAFNAGSLDNTGSVNDADQVYVKNAGSTLGAYIGRRTSPFYGAAVENPSFTVSLEADEAGTADGFTVDISSYLVLTNNPDTANNGTGTVTWSTTTATVYLDRGLGMANALSEVNAFYHLNAIHRYFDPINLSAPGVAAADLSGQVPVMVHANGEADVLAACTNSCVGMMNAYYDLDKDYIVMGDGLMDVNNKYRSFALDGTIVRHEYIHQVMARIYPIINFGEFGAVSEGVADYLALASFWKEGRPEQGTLGNYVSPSTARDLSATYKPTGPRSMPGDWWGEVHEDGMILSQALYMLRTSTPSTSNKDLGTFSLGYFSGQAKADVLTYAALFYFPDNYSNFYEAMQDACAQFNTRWFGQCDSAASLKIRGAFDFHGIGPAGLGGGDSYETSATSGMCKNNNGPECASDISNLSAVSATIYPLGDVDYYSLPLSKGNFSVRLDLPAATSEGIYHAYSMFIFDSKREYVTEAYPPVYGTGSDACSISGPCYTLSPSVTMDFAVPAGGDRYYLVVSAGLNEYSGNSEANSSTPYSLTLSRAPQGSASASLETPIFDSDEIAFEVPYPDFHMVGSVSSSTVNPGLPPGGAELVFEYAQLRNHNYEPISLTRTNAAGSYLLNVPSALNYTNTDSLGRILLRGRVKLQPGFSARYPGVGTVYLEVFGRNHLGHVLSLGISNSLNLSSDKTAVTAYNNIITSAGGAAIIKYDVQSAGSLSIKVYTQTGALVKTVYDGPIPAGKGTRDWDGTNSVGGKAASGIYFVKTKGPGLDKVVKIAVVR
ncbi:MAG: FlgD immunoglobulin-like domain containing protein [Elusimicrobiota bacterium]|nr:FlgD immunoglobulin-like domain containing protein [Elusimicrobiota bacterium]